MTPKQSFQVNGEIQQVQVAPNTPLLYVLQLHQHNIENSFPGSNITTIAIKHRPQPRRSVTNARTAVTTERTHLGKTRPI